jgi:hypothetical protein
MTCENAELRLEIGEGLFFPIIGQPDITDQLNSHGATCSLQIRVGKNAVLPKAGSLAFLTRLLGSTRTKLFGGICPQVSPQLGVAFDTVSLSLNNYVEYTRYTPIQNYRYTDSLASHIFRAAGLAGVYNNPDSTRQLLDLVINPDPDDNNSFLFAFENGDLSSFLDQICSLRNCSWTIRDTGAILISTLGIYNAILIVNTNNVVVDVAPEPILSIPEPGESSCNVFWQANTLSYTLVEPIASSIIVYGRNGKLIPASGQTLLNPDIRSYIAVADRTEYPISRTADELIKVLVKIGMADPIEFDKILFSDLADPNNPIPTAGFNQAVVRPEEFLIYVNATDVPPGAIVQILHITRFIKATAQDATAIAYFKSVANGAGNGEKVHVENREDIVDQVTAQALADSLRRVLCATNFTTGFGCIKTIGWKAGQQFVARHNARNIYFLVTINSVKIKLRNGGRDYYNIDAGTIRIMSESDAQNKILESQANPIKAALPFATPGLYLG